jgi:SAM-dependent methyltransferase
VDLKELESGVNPHKHWYYQTKKICLLNFFRTKVVEQGKRVTVIDIGAGSGFFSLELYRTYRDYIEKIFLVDLHYTEEEILNTRDVHIQKLRSMPIDVDNAFLVMMDVIEHVENDRQFVKEIFSKLSARTYFYITVPAFQSLWSGHDVFLGHYRRYTLPQITGLVKQTGSHINQAYYQYALIFPLVWILRRWSNPSDKPQNDMKAVSPMLNWLLEKLLSLEMSLAKHNQLFGLTCVIEGFSTKK